MYKKLLLYCLVVAVWLPSGNLAAEEIINHLMTRDPKDNTGCETPIPSDTFLTTDERVYSWLAIEDIIEGDVVKWEWYDPDSTLYHEGTYTASFTGNGCTWAWIVIKDDLPADMPGDWHVDVFYNDTFQFTDNFTIRSSCPARQIYGNNSETTQRLRQFRDKILSTTPDGREMIRLYYKWSPVIVKAMEEDEEFKEEVKEWMDGAMPLIKKFLH